MQTGEFIQSEIILIGGGHAHSVCLKKFAMKPIQGARLTLISDVYYAPYSGMLPGFIAGHYEFSQMHIDLPKLCQISNARFIFGKVNGLDIQNQKIHLESGLSLNFDICSINIGSTPKQDHEFFSYGTMVKPISRFIEEWQTFLTILPSLPNPAKIIIMGVGAGGIELACAISYRLQKRVSITLIDTAQIILSDFSHKLRQKIFKHLQRQNIRIISGAKIYQINSSCIILDSGSISYDKLFWVSSAQASGWPQKAGFQCDPSGFIYTHSTLQTLSHPMIFAVGDASHILGAPRPKAGVFSVRQGKDLYQNLIALLTDKKLKAHKPQKNFLRLVALGSKKAAAYRSIYLGSGHLWWVLKDYIDQKFMRKFWQVPTKFMPARRSTTLSVKGFTDNQKNFQTRCLGCATKLPSSDLRQTFTQFSHHPACAPNFSDEDAYFIESINKLLISVDTIPAPLSDPYIAGKIALIHSFNDIIARNGQAHSALVSLALPGANSKALLNDFNLAMTAIMDELQLLNAKLIGGHTYIGEQLALTITANGICQSKPWIKKNLSIGDCLILTKPLGSGILLAAHMRSQLSANNLQNLLSSMLASHHKILDCPYKEYIHASTDITGFGLIGHLSEMLQMDQKISLWQNSLPIFNGVREAIDKQITSSAHLANYASSISQIANIENFKESAVLFDPQTSGGLVFSVPRLYAEKIVAWIRSNTSCQKASIIGEITSRKSTERPFILE